MIGRCAVCSECRIQDATVESADQVHSLDLVTPLNMLPVPAVDVTTDAQMPCDSWDHEGQTGNDCDPQHPLPLANIPSVFTESPHSEGYM